MAVRLNARTARAGCARELYQSSQILTRHSGARAKPASPESIITVGGYEADQVHVPVSLSRAQFMLTARARAAAFPISQSGPATPHRRDVPTTDSCKYGIDRNLAASATVRPHLVKMLSRYRDLSSACRPTTERQYRGDLRGDQPR
jgi:hypothetical protein